MRVFSLLYIVRATSPSDIAVEPELCSIIMSSGAGGLFWSIFKALKMLVLLASHFILKIYRVGI